MAFQDWLTDVCEIQKPIWTEDGAGGRTLGDWESIVRVSCRVATMSSRARRTYDRPGTETLLTVECDDLIPTTEGQATILSLLNEPEKERYRILYDNRRTFEILGFGQLSQGVADGPAGRRVFIDVMETPEIVGIIDKAG